MKQVLEWIGLGKPRLYTTSKRICPFCGVEFKPLNRGGIVFCSRSCATLAHNKLRELGIYKKKKDGGRPWDGGTRPDFAGCKHPMFGKKHSISTRKIISEKTKQVWISGQVYNKKYRENQCKAQKEAAKIRPNYKGGISKVRIKIRADALYKKWRTLVFIRDNFSCVKCGQIGGTIHAHHIKPMSDLIDKYGITELEQAKTCVHLWDVDNGETLCQNCHSSIHGRQIGVRLPTRKTPSNIRKLFFTK